MGTAYSGAMLKMLRKLGGAGAAAAVVLWWLRVLAHSKQPPAEGRWQELRFEEE